MSERIQIWDVPTRVFHWSLVLSFCGAFLTAESEAYRDIHAMFGYTVLGLIAFRVLWGIVGGRYARFASFLFKPGDIIAYVMSLFQGRAERYVGHNPLGSVAIWLLLSLALVSGATGMWALQDNHAVEELHEGLSFVMLFVVFAHIAGVAVSSILHGENLVRSMITGNKEAGPEQAESRSAAWLGVIMIVALVTFWAAYSAFGMMSPETTEAHAGQEADDD